MQTTHHQVREYLFSVQHKYRAQKFAKLFASVQSLKNFLLNLIKVKIKFSFTGEAVDANNAEAGQRISIFSINCLSVQAKYRF